MENAANTQEFLESTPQVDEVNETKAYSERLNRDRERIRNEEREKIINSERNDIAKSFGYESWEDYTLAQSNSKLIEKGLDPDQVKPILDELIEKNPKYQEAMRYKKEKEDLDKQIFASNAIKELNSKFGTNYSSINDLDEDTVSMWNNGVSLEKAFADNNKSVIQENTLKGARLNETNKQHLKPINSTGSGAQNEDIIVSDKEFKLFELFNPKASKQDYIAYLKKNRR
jgi:hypothetical protein